MKIVFVTLLLLMTHLNAELIRDNTTNTVLDTNTLIMWQDDEDSKTIELVWQDAIDYCENNVSLAGYSDWRLPNVNELTYIIDNSIITAAESDLVAEVGPGKVLSGLWKAFYKGLRAKPLGTIEAIDKLSE